jgi:small subunit ribosomal protein S7
MVQKKLNKGILNTLNLNLSHKFINLLMLNGKKNVAQKILLDTLTLIKAETKQHPMKILRIAIKNVAPIVEVRSIRKRRTYFSVPVPLRKSYRISLAIK